MLLYGAGIVFAFLPELALLFAPDPPAAATYECSFQQPAAPPIKHIVEMRGFYTIPQGLALSPGASGSLVFSFRKKRGQGCLLRIWLYGDDGGSRPNAVRISTDGGTTFRQVAGSANRIGAVIDLTGHVLDAEEFRIACEAANHDFFPQVFFEKLQLVVTADRRTQPSLPNLPKIIALLLCPCLLMYCAFRGGMPAGRAMRLVVLLSLVLLAFHLRWSELLRVSGTPLDPDAAEYAVFAKKMALFSDTGFYSAAFGIREPLYILAVKGCYALFGESDTRLRFVSCAFSLAVILLAYRVGTAWFNALTGLCAAGLLAIHPYLIGLSARGLREEFFTTLLLLFMYCSVGQQTLSARARTLLTGVLIGLILLTRCEWLPLMAITTVCLPLVAKNQWHIRRAVIALALGTALFVPHLSGIYKQHGDPLYTLNRVAEFYTQRDMAERSVSHASEDTGKHADTTMPLLFYYFKMHTPWHLVHHSVVGFAKIHLNMPMQFAFGKGNRELIRQTVAALRTNPSGALLTSTCRTLFSVFAKHAGSYSTAGAVLLLFVAGLLIVGMHRCWTMYLLLPVFQLHTSFLAYNGIDPRLSVPSYPLMAFCCGYAVSWMHNRWLRQRFNKHRVPPVL